MGCTSAGRPERRGKAGTLSAFSRTESSSTSSSRTPSTTSSTATPRTSSSVSGLAESVSGESKFSSWEGGYGARSEVDTVLSLPSGKHTTEYVGFPSASSTGSQKGSSLFRPCRRSNTVLGVNSHEGRAITSMDLRGKRNSLSWKVPLVGKRSDGVKSLGQHLLPYILKKTTSVQQWNSSPKGFIDPFALVTRLLSSWAQWILLKMNSRESITLIFCWKAGSCRMIII